MKYKKMSMASCQGRISGVNSIIYLMSGNHTSKFKKSIITPEVKEQVKARTSLVDLVRPQVPDLKKKGKYYWGCCPFHNEKTPSFHVREEEGRYHCFGCGATGDAITFTMETQGLDFPEAVKDLAERSGVQLEYEEVDPEAQKQKENGFSALEAVDVFYKNSYAGSASAHYINDQRGLTEETVKEFGLGHAPDGWRNALHHLQQAGYSNEIIEKAGLAKTSDKGGEPYDMFRNRLLFPIHDLKKRVVGFGGRRLSNDEKAGPKYLNSPDTPFFNKGYLLYNLNRNADIIRRTESALIVEGYMDVIALWQAGIHTAVAPLGTAITADQVQLLWRYCGAPTVCLDGDTAGQGAAVRVAKRILPILEPGRTLMFVFLPEGEDPDTFVKKEGREAFLKLTNAPKTLEEVLWQDVTAGMDLTVADQRASVDAAIGSLMSEISNSTIQTHLRRALKDRLWQSGRSGGKQSHKPVEAATASRNYLPDVQGGGAARKLLALVCRQPKILEEFEESFLEISYENQEDRQVHTEIVRLLTREGVEAEALQPYLLESGVEEHVSSLLTLTATDMDVNDVKAQFAKLFTDLTTRSSQEERQAQLVQDLQVDPDQNAWEKMKLLRAEKRQRRK